MKRRVVGVVAAVLLAAIGTFVLLAYVRSAEDRALAGEQVVQVFVVSEAIERGASGNAIEARVRLTKLPAKVEAADSVSDLSALEGKVAAVDLVPGEQLLSTRFVAPEALAAQGDIDVPEGLLQVSVSLESQRALGGRLLPGDTVGVLASFDPLSGQDPPGEEPALQSPHSTHLILHKVLVTQVQGGTAPVAVPGPTEPSTTATAPGGNVLVTLAVDAGSVERIVFAAEHGFLWLAHEPATAPEDGTSIQTRETIYQ